MSKTLYLSLKPKPFRDIISGKKKEEYRENKPHWIKRLFDKNGLRFDEIFFRNGYTRDRPFVRVELKGYEIDDVDGVIILKLGKILEVKIDENIM